MADSKNKDEAIRTSRRSGATAPKRVSGGLILKAKKKKRRTQPSSSTIHGHGQCAANLLSSSSSSSGVPSILSSIPANNTGTEEKCSSSGKNPSSDDEFGDDAFDDNDFDVPSDALLCLQTYTRSSSGCMSETCAYCPIFATEGGDSSSSSITSEMCEANESRRSISTHAAPFLPKKVMLHLLDAQSSNHSTSNNTSSSSSIAHIEQQIKKLASSNKILMLQLHGTATARSGGGTTGWRGDGNDDEDVAIMETSVYEAVAGMTLQDFFLEDSLAAIQPKFKVKMVHSWLISTFLPYFAGKTWFSSGALDSFYEYAVANKLKETRASNKKKNDPTNQYTISQMKQMTQHLIHARLLLPRRGVGGGGGGEGYWFSLPGLGKAAKSIVDGRTNLLRRLQSSRYKEKKRSVLEHEIGRVRGRGNNDDNAAKKTKMEQAGKFVVLDLLAKGWVSIHTTCTGEQFVRLAA